MRALGISFVLVWTLAAEGRASPGGRRRGGGLARERGITEIWSTLAVPLSYGAACAALGTRFL